MAEPLKDLINPAAVRAAARQFARHDRSFDPRRFVALALPGLEQLEFKARALRICDALQATLPQHFVSAAALIEASLAPAGDDAGVGGVGDAGLRGWILWPVGEFVARQGLAEPGRALEVLHALTQRFTAEFAIRPFIVQHPALVFDTLQRWTRDPSDAVRRLVSEGSRPRLPWAMRLDALVADPSPTLPLLAALQDDPSAAVRRSVANHLNDIAKDHPERVADWLEAHLSGASAERRALLHHASRTLIKSGHRRVLAAWGVDREFSGRATLRLAPRRLRIGEVFELQLTLHSTAAHAQKLVIDFAVHHVKADGRRTAKVFKGWQLELPAHGQRTLTRRHSMREITTRRYHPGRHAVDLRINGRVLDQAGFDLLPPAPPRTGCRDRR